MRAKRLTTAEELSLALQWEEVRAEYLANNQRLVEADLARAKAQVFSINYRKVLMDKPLPKIAIRILGRPGIESLERPGEGIGEIHWRCWASKEGSAPNGSDGIRETSLGSIESWAKSLRGPTDPECVPPVAEVFVKHVETGVIRDLDLQSLRSYIERGMEQRFGWMSQMEYSRMDSIDRYELDESLAKRYKISAERLDAFSLVIAIADEATDSNHYRNFLRKQQRWQREGEAKCEALLASEVAV